MTIDPTRKQESGTPKPAAAKVYCLRNIASGLVVPGHERLTLAEARVALSEIDAPVQHFEIQEVEPDSD